MSQERIGFSENREELAQTASEVEGNSGATRREFMQKTLVAAAAVAATGALPGSSDAQSGTGACPGANADLQTITAMTHDDKGTLQVTMTVTNENKSYWV